MAWGCWGLEFGAGLGSSESLGTDFAARFFPSDRRRRAGRPAAQLKDKEGFAESRFLGPRELQTEVSETFETSSFVSRSPILAVIRSSVRFSFVFFRCFLFRV